MFLSKIIEQKKRELDEKMQNVPLSQLKEKADKLFIRSMFKRNIARKGHMNLIAEIKKRSPSKGVLRRDFDPIKIGLTYQANGASAISVLTDERFFDGDLKYLVELGKRLSIPVLRKDFIIDEYQIYESAASGADAVLLIAHILTHEELSRFGGLVRELGMDALVEIHNEEELEKALYAHSSIIGINNRDLSSFEVDLKVTERLVHKIPPGKVIVAESGIATYEDMMFLKSLGVNAVLIGEAFMVAQDIADKMREIMRD